VLGGCAAPNADGIYDPLEGVNRKVFDFNHTLDNRAALPAATYYKSALPEDVRTGVHNFLANLSVPVDLANDVLQGEFTQAGYAVCRVSVNTTVGMLGVLDPAAGMGCPDRDEDFGQTLGVYGVPGGPYLVLPLLGSSLPRDVVGKVFVDHYFNPLAYLHYRGKFYVGLGQNVIKVVDQRSHAVAALREIVGAFRCCHEIPSLADYQLLLAESAEAAWMATEGCAFNHATDRVADVDMTASQQRALSRPMKDSVEVSTAGSVRQTAFKADPVLRTLRSADGGATTLTVPGSFYEFISRDMIAGPDGSRQLDLRFDSMNAQGIFRMTAAA